MVLTLSQTLRSHNRRLKHHSSASDDIVEVLDDFRLPKSVVKEYGKLAEKERFLNHKNSFYARIAGIEHNPAYEKNHNNRFADFVKYYPRVARAVAMRHFVDMKKGSPREIIDYLNEQLSLYGHRELSYHEKDHIRGIDNSIDSLSSAIKKKLQLFPDDTQYNNMLYICYVRALRHQKNSYDEEHENQSKMNHVIEKFLGY